MKNTVLSVENLSVVFRTDEGETRAVRSVSFQLFEGETLAIVGESGCGKSATAKALIGLLPPSAKITDGSVFYGGRDALKCSARSSTVCALLTPSVRPVWTPS